MGPGAVVPTALSQHPPSRWIVTTARVLEGPPLAEACPEVGEEVSGTPGPADGHSRMRPGRGTGESQLPKGTPRSPGGTWAVGRRTYRVGKHGEGAVFRK